MFLLLDGLDEVADDAQRSMVRDAVANSSQPSPSLQPFLGYLPSYAYQDPQHQLDQFVNYTLAALGRSKATRSSTAGIARCAG